MTRLLHILRILTLDDDTRNQLGWLAVIFGVLWLLAFVTGGK